MSAGQLPQHNVISTSILLPGLNTRPGRVLEAEIRRKFGTSITPDSHHPHLYKPFYLLFLLGDVVIVSPHKRLVSSFKQ